MRKLKNTGRRQTLNQAPDFRVNERIPLLGIIQLIGATSRTIHIGPSRIGTQYDALFKSIEILSTRQQSKLIRQSLVGDIGRLQVATK